MTILEHMNRTEINWTLEECECSDLTKEDYSNAYALYNFTLLIISMPLVSIFGVLSNVVNVFLYTRPSLVSSGNMYLAALGVSDFFVVITGLFMFWIDSARTYLRFLKYAPYMIVYALPIGYMAQTCSVYFTVGAAIDCYITVCWNPMFSTWVTQRRSRQIIFAIVCGSVIYNSLRFGQFNLNSCLPSNETTTSIIEICPTELFFEINTIYNVYMYMILMTFLPFLLLSILNGLIVGRVRTVSALARITAIQFAGSCADTVATPSGDGTITMIMVVIMFLACNTLALVVNIVETFCNVSTIALNYMTDTSNFLVIFNSSVNFVVYMVFSKDFRRLFNYYFCGCCKKETSKPTNGYALVAMSETNPLSFNANPEALSPIMLDQTELASEVPWVHRTSKDRASREKTPCPSIYDNAECMLIRPHQSKDSSRSVILTTSPRKLAESEWPSCRIHKNSGSISSNNSSESKEKYFFWRGIKYIDASPSKKREYI